MTAARILERARVKGWRFATAESCTGGMVSASLTEVPGSSDVFDRGFVTYSNQAKQDMLGVRGETLTRFGAVSEETAAEMAEGALRHSSAHLAVSITGIAGPDGGTAEKPVGLVYFAAGRRDGPIASEGVMFGDLGRTEVQRRSVVHAMKMLRALL